MQELDKKASKTQLGRVVVGDNLDVDEEGKITHPTQAGYKHIPAGGAVGQVLKNNGNGSAEWGTLDIKDKLDRGNLPTAVSDGKTIYDLLENNGGINIDTALLYLNDAGTKTQGKVYFDRNKKGLFECIQTTTSTTNSTTYFVDISNKASSDRLANLGSELTKINDWNVTHLFNNYFLIQAFMQCHAGNGPNNNFPFKIIPESSMLSATVVGRDTMVNFNGYTATTFNLDSTGVYDCYVWGIVKKA